jgi:peptidoglycan/LPS O-acetylase OafA/YrhL
MNRADKIDGHESNLDFIRAFAVLVVVAAHLGWFFGDIHLGVFEISLLGRLGVVIFFAHSGIVNLLSIERHVAKYGEQRLFRAFMTRRCLRIYPLSVFVVAVIFATHIPVAHINKLSAAPANHPTAAFVPSLLLVQNFFRFDQLVEPLWSLPYEIQMYCFFPFIFLALRRFSTPRILIFAWAALAAVEFVAEPHILKHGNPGHIFAVPDMLYFFLWFLSGIYAYKEMQVSTRILPFWTLPALIGFLCVICLFSYDRNKFLFISLCCGLALPYFQSCQSAPLNRLCAQVAKYSYGIYLLHDPALWLGFVRFAHFPVTVRLAVFLCTTFGGSVLLYHALERPMIRVGNRLAGAISSGKRVRPSTQLFATAAGAGR